MSWKHKVAQSKISKKEIFNSEFYKKGGGIDGIQPLDKNGEPKIDDRSLAILEERVTALPQTKSMYVDANGVYTPERKALHKEIINKFKKDAVCITKGKPIAILMGGSPASGKSSFVKKYRPYLLTPNILKVDADEIRAQLPEYKGFNATQTHLETKDIVTTLISDRNIGVPCDFDMVYDGTMNNTKSYEPLIDLLKKHNYQVYIIYITNVDKDTVWKRAKERYKKSGRFVPKGVIDDFFEKGDEAFQKLKKEVDGYVVVDGGDYDYDIIERGGKELPQEREYKFLGKPMPKSKLDKLNYKYGGSMNVADLTDVSTFEEYVIDNISTIQSNMRRNGIYDVDDIKSVKELAMILGVETSALEGINVKRYAELTDDILEEQMEDGEMAKGGNITSLKDIPNLINEVKAKRVTYRGASNGTRIKVQGKEYLISSDDFKKLDWDEKNMRWKNNIEFSAPQRKMAQGGGIENFKGTITDDSAEHILKSLGYNFNYQHDDITGTRFFGELKQLKKAQNDLYKKYGIESEIRGVNQVGLKELIVPNQIVDYAQGGSIGTGKNGYVAFYKGKEIDVYADTKYQAQKIAAAHFKAKKEWEVNVALAEVDGKQYVNTAYQDGGMVDLFEDYENIPENVQGVLDDYTEDFEDGNYEGMQNAKEEIEQLGYTFDFYVDGSAYGLRPVGVELNELEGYEEYKKGGTMKNENNEMLRNQVVEAKHHVAELAKEVNSRTSVEPWVIAKMERATTDLSDVTHYLDGLQKMEHGGSMYKEGGAIKGSNPKTGEKYGVVIGSEKKSNEYVQNGFEINVRKGYGSRISEKKLVFDSNKNLRTIIDYGYSLDGYPSTSSGSATNVNANTKETIKMLSEMYNPSFAKKIFESISDKYAVGGEILGRNITFEDWKGDTRKGTVISILDNGDYEVSTDSGMALVTNDEIIKMKKGGYVPKSKKLTPQQQAKLETVLHEYKMGKLHSGSKTGPIVKSRKQALAIGLAEARSTKMAQGGRLDVGVYRVGKPTKVSPNLYEQKIVEIFDNGDIATASDYGRKLSDFKSQKYPVITKEQLDSQYKMAQGGSTNDGKIRFDMYGYIKTSNRVQDGDTIIRVNSYEEAKEKAKQYLNKNNYQLVELYRKDDFVGSIKPSGKFVYSSKYKKEEMAKGGALKGTTYVSNRDIKKIAIEKGGQKYNLTNKNIIDGVYVKDVPLNQMVKSKSVNESLSVFKKIVKESSSFDEAFEKSKTTYGIPLETARYFSEKYNPSGKLSQKETFKVFYDEIKGGSMGWKHKK